MRAGLQVPKHLSLSFLCLSSAPLVLPRMPAPGCLPPSGILPLPAPLLASLWVTSSWVPTAGFRPAQPPLSLDQALLP